MTFDRAWILLLAWLPLAWLAWEWRTGRQKTNVTLKALALTAVLLALSEPRVNSPETKLAVSLLVDTSASVSDGDIARASRIASELDRNKGRNVLKIIPFARTSRAVTPEETATGVKLGRTAGENGRGTDLEAAIREGLAAMPEGLVPRVVLLSDGKENKGSVTRAAWQARQLGVPIDVIPLAGRAKPALRLESVTLPGRAFAGDRFPIDIHVESPRAAKAKVELSAEGKVIGSSALPLEKGMNRLRVHVALTVPGAIDLAGVITAPELGEARFAQSISLRKPRAQFVTEDPAGSEKHLVGILNAGQFEVQVTDAVDTAKLDDTQLLILNNIDIEKIPLDDKERMETWVKQGGGLMLIGGERMTFIESKKVEDALDRALPAKLAPPRSPEGTLVVLIVDKSSSMEGRKMELARVASIGVIENLRPVDLVGVLIFDNSFQWAVPIRKAEDRQMIKRLVAGITPDGGTQIAPALAEAYRKTVPVKATFKHVVLLTDGISEEGDSLGLAKEAVTQNVTISTVGLGQDVNRAYLEKIAAFSKGKSYFLNDPAGLEQILLKDVMEFTGSTAIEKPIVPVVERQAEILEGVAVASAPPLRGYTKFIAKPTAETILSIDKKDPLLTRWQFGLGRAAVFTSDAKNRWAEQWLTWNGFDRFWANLLRDLLPHAQSGEANVEFDPVSSNLEVVYRLSRSMPEPKSVPPIFVFGPEGYQQPVEVRKAGDGVFRGRVNIGTRQGLFRIRPVDESRVFFESGLYRQEAELADYGNNESVLRQLAGFTGGRYNPAPARIFEAEGRSVASTTRLWPGLLALAVVLNLIELAVRKWRGVIPARWLGGAMAGQRA
ncbi:MAG: VWA domain-containing protein [Acidobacteria bacterium]|nr:VWA domain-containing protein [Acidobacteriota bacterium]